MGDRYDVLKKQADHENWCCGLMSTEEWIERYGTDPNRIVYQPSELDGGIRVWDDEIGEHENIPQSDDQKLAKKIFIIVCLIGIPFILWLFSLPY